jgi:hypothetical protein
MALNVYGTALMLTFPESRFENNVTYVNFTSKTLWELLVLVCKLDWEF